MKPFTASFFSCENNRSVLIEFDKEKKANDPKKNANADRHFEDSYSVMLVILNIFSAHYGPSFIYSWSIGPHFGTWILLFGPFGLNEVKNKLSISEQLLRVNFSTFCEQKKFWAFRSNFWGWFFQLFVSKKKCFSGFFTL